MKRVGGAASRGALREAADSCGLTRLLVGFIAEASALSRLPESERYGAIISACGGGAEDRLEACVCYNILSNPTPIHLPQPAAWVWPILLGVGEAAGRMLPPEWRRCIAMLPRRRYSVLPRAQGNRWLGSSKGRGVDSLASSYALHVDSHGRDGKPALGALCRYLSEADAAIHEGTRRVLASRAVPPAASVSGLLASGRELFEAGLLGEEQDTEAHVRVDGPSPRMRARRGGGGSYVAPGISRVASRLATSVRGGVNSLLTWLRDFSVSEVAGALGRVATQRLVGASAGPAVLERRLEERARPSPVSSGVTSGRPWARGLDDKGGSCGVLGGSGWSMKVSRRQAEGLMRSISLPEIALTLVKREAGLRLRSRLQARFPRKQMSQATSKVNVFLDSLLMDLAAYDPTGCSLSLSILDTVPAGTLYEDQVCGAVLHAFSLCHGRAGATLLLILVLGLAAGGTPLQGLSDVLKATGSNTSFEWAHFCELHCLLGRGAGELDLKEDAARRCRPKPDMEVEVDPVKLETAVRAVLAEELGTDNLIIDDLDRHWDRRFEWCVAGAHAASVNQCGGFSCVPSCGPGGRKMTRRMAMEYVEGNPLHSWDGEVKVSVIPKLEHGKIRAIYSCNTISYAIFSRVLRPAERKWAGRRVIVDPGAGGNYGMFKRIRTAWPRSLPVAVMLDYADFNSQHTLGAQQTVIRCLLERCPGISAAEKETMIASFDRMYIYHSGALVGRCRRSLMSGHRGTSFINSVLNAAYLRVVLGEDGYAKLQSFHVGDDVLIFARDERSGYEIIQAMTAAGFHLQAKKQSVGRAGFEFLRMAGTRRAARGYLARSVASTVSGSWTSDERLGAIASLHNAVQQARSLINRSGNMDCYKLLLRSAYARTSLPLSILGEVLSGQVAVGAGPVYRADGHYYNREVLELDLAREHHVDSIPWRKLARHATSDYFARGRADLEEHAMFLVGYKPWLAALRSTYGDLAGVLNEPGPDDGDDTPRAVALGVKRMFTKSGVVSLDTELDKPVQRGLLVHYPIIVLLQHSLDNNQIGELLRAAGHLCEPGAERIAAFGDVKLGSVINGWLPYSDAAALGARGLWQTVRVLYPLRM
ncbi:RNA-dependent RNA polymerase [Eimeriavirus ni]|uniref:RNA-directed RNA polymerase n=1 Tax=Eimeria stiedai RNA virus 1 TaxID=1898175 RepID=A0A1C9C4I9_9VIRU|nr:RNA-dependent RNA polymerase [Eimeria stiedai RNA virus 1]AOM63180.1 RNA-dependent RNA polymerase [Eimeria stiedai RNA virus 1]